MFNAEKISCRVVLTLLYNGFQLSVENNNVGLFEVRSTVRFVWFRKLSLNRSQPGSFFRSGNLLVFSLNF